VTSPKNVDIAAILNAVYRPPAEQLDQLALRVRARLALLETVGEAVRLLVEAPASAINSTLGSTEEPDAQETQQEEHPRVAEQ
jgi:hypothetical protein